MQGASKLEHIPQGVAGVYAIRNSANGKTYVGSSKNIAERLRSHLRSLKRGANPARHLQRAWNAHGEQSFSVECLEVVSDVETLIATEQRWIDLLNASDFNHGYNARPIADRNSGWKMPKSGRERISAALTGRPVSAETREKLSRSNTGKTHSVETREKLSEIKRGKPLGPMRQETKDKLSLARSGKSLSEEHRARLSISHLGIRLSAETREKQSLALKGRSKSPETRARMAVAQQARFHALRTNQGGTQP